MAISEVAGEDAVFEGSEVHTVEKEWKSLMELEKEKEKLRQSFIRDKLPHISRLIAGESPKDNERVTPLQDNRFEVSIGQDMCRVWAQPPHSRALRCDIRDLNVSEIGTYDVALIDPAWKVAGGDNSRGLNLGYTTVSDPEVLSIPLSMLVPEGICAIWVVPGKEETCKEWMSSNGFIHTETVIWVKSTNNGSVRTSMGPLLQHAHERMLIGLRGKPQNLRRMRSCDVIFEQPRIQTKPEAGSGV